MKCKGRPNRALLFAILAVLSLSIPLHSWAASGRTRLAVTDFEQKGASEFKGRQAGEIVAEWLITALVKTGRFDVVERAQLQRILQEQQLGMSGVINQETAAKVGQLLGVKVIITGAVIQFGSSIDVNARLISVEDGSILRAERIRASSLEAIEGMMDTLVSSIKKDFPLEGFVVIVSGKRAMIDLGRINGVETGMRFMAYRRGADVRHPVTGKMLRGEDIPLGEMVVQSIDQETSWVEIVKEEAGVKIAAGNQARSTEEARAPQPSPPPSGAQIATAVVRPWTGQARSYKILVDWVGTNDLMLGDRDGFVTLYPNRGTKDSPRYDAGVKVKAAGKEIKVRSPSAPLLIDWNGDGKVDLLVGNGGGYLHLFLNQGSPEVPPKFGSGIMIQAAGKNLDVGGKASPCVIDWNEDGKKDLLMGNSSGELHLFLNEGTNDRPVFGRQIKLNGGSLDVGSNSSVDVTDWNGDGKKDLIVGNDDGEIFVFMNKGSNESPEYDDKGEKLAVTFGSDASPQILSRGRGVNDLVVADRNGEVTLSVNTGSAGSPKFPEKRVLRAGKR